MHASSQEMKTEKMKVKHLVPFLLFLGLATICASLPSHKLNQNDPFEKKHFVLVHGAGHGAWCWYKVATLLTSVGHNVTSLDLPGPGIDPEQVQQIHSISDYTEPFIKLMASLPLDDRVILVSHSLGGITISIAMETFPHKIAAAVFATAGMPGLALSLSTISDEFRKNTDFLDTRYRFDEGSDEPETAVFFGQKYLASSFYQLSPPEDLTLASTLTRWAPVFHEELILTKEKYGSVLKAFIICDQVHSVKLDLQLLMINKNPPDEVKVINGSDHMVMFSRPLELFANLQQIAHKYT